MATKNIVPRNNNEGSIGTSAKRWNAAHIATVTGNLTGTADNVVGLDVTSGKTLTVLKSITFTSPDDTSVITLPAGTTSLLNTVGGMTLDTTQTVTGIKTFAPTDASTGTVGATFTAATGNTNAVVVNQPTAGGTGITINQTNATTGIGITVNSASGTGLRLVGSAVYGLSITGTHSVNAEIINTVTSGTALSLRSTGANGETLLAENTAADVSDVYNNYAIKGISKGGRSIWALQTGALSYNTSKPVFSAERTTSGSGRTVSGDLFFGNDAGTTTTRTGNLLRLQDGGVDKFIVDLTGKITSSGGLNIPTGTPSSQTDTGGAGDIKWSATTLYICTATNHWRRVSLDDTAF